MRSEGRAYERGETILLCRHVPYGATPVKNFTPSYPTKIVHLKICLREFDFVF